LIGLQVNLWLRGLRGFSSPIDGVAMTNEKRGVPSETIQQIRERIDIVDLISTYVSLSKAGQNFKGLCPFHSEKSPSFSVNPANQYFHCFGCQAGGDALTFLMKQENMDFMEALRELSQRAGIPLPEPRQVVSRPRSGLSRERYCHLYQLAASWYHRNLQESPEAEDARAYLDRRGIARQSWTTYQLGYAPEGWNGLSNWLGRQEVTPEELIHAGLVVRKDQEGARGFSTYDRFRNRVIFPIADTRGQVIGFGGRVMQEEASPKYLNSPDTPIYTKGKLLYGWNLTKDAIREQGEIILVEGYTDFLALLQAGIPNAAASLGTSLTSEQVMQASRFESRVIVSYDADAAGIKAALRAISLCFEQGVEIRVLTLPKGYDPDSYIRKYGPEEFIIRIQESTQGLKFLIDSYVQGRKIESPEQKNIVARYIVSEIRKIPDTIIQSEYLKQTSEELSIDEGVLRSLIKAKTEKKEEEQKTVFLNAEKRLLQILFDDSTIGPAVFKVMKTEDYKGLNSESIFRILSDFFNDGKEPNFQNMREKVDRDLFSSLSKIIQEKEQAPSVNEAMECVRALRQYALENRYQGLKHKITTLEKAHEIKRMLSVMKELQDVKMQLSRLPNQEL